MEKQVLKLVAILICTNLGMKLIPNRRRQSEDQIRLVYIFLLKENRLPVVSKNQK